MRIDYINYPALKFIEKKYMESEVYTDGGKAIYTNPYSSYTDYHKDIFNKICTNRLDKGLYYVTDSFLDAIHQKGVFEKLRDIYYEVPKGTGVYLDSLHQLFLYEVKSNEDSKEVTIYCFYKNCLVGFYNVILDKAGGGLENKANFTSDRETGNSTSTFLLIAIISLFREYANVDVKHLNKKTGGTIFNCVYSNDTEKNIKVLDSTWFTTLVKSEGFKVRGHFRLQPKKHKGKWTKELIWISEFQKNGYIREAGILKQTI